MQETGVEAESVNIKQSRVDRLTGYDLLALGAPTQYFTASKPLKIFLEQLKGLDLKGRRGFAFDTRLDSRLSGSAAKFIEKRLQELGIDIIRPRASALVVCEKGAKPEDTMLKDGMEDLFESIGKELGTLDKDATGESGMTERQHLGWAEKEASRDRMTLSERGGEIATVIGIILVALFFYAHQAWSTGFFTSAFASTEAFLLYGSILTGMAGSVARLVTGRRNISRLLELATSIFWIVSWLFYVFPFNFAHFADMVPKFLRFLVSWITNDIARIPFALGILGGVAFIPVNVILYLMVRRLLRR